MQTLGAPPCARPGEMEKKKSELEERREMEEIKTKSKQKQKDISEVKPS